MIIEIPDNTINNMVRENLIKTIAEAKQSHMTDVVNRFNGQDVRHEADWIKYMIVRHDETPKP